jgi:hypothetical protein
VIAHLAETLVPRTGKPDPLADRLGEQVLYRRSLQEEIVALEHQQRRLEHWPCASAPNGAMPHCGPK